MPNQFLGYFYDSLNGIIEGIDAGPPLVQSQSQVIARHDHKPTVGTETVILGDHGTNINVQPGINENLFRAGGGLQTITVPFWVRRESKRGDMEYHVWRMLRNLARTDLGELTIGGQTWDNCWFTGGQGSIFRAMTSTDAATPPGDRVDVAHSRGELSFVRGLPSTAPLTTPTVGAPTAPAAIPTADHDGQYRAFPDTGGDIKLGRWADVESVSVSRPALMHAMARSFGVRVMGRNHTQTAIRTGNDTRRGRAITLTLRGFVRTAEDNEGNPDPPAHFFSGQFNEMRAKLEDRIHTLFHSLRDLTVTIAGNGTSFTNLQLESATMDDDPLAYCGIGFRMVFKQSFHEFIVL